jgi:hypothetical protein
VNRIAELERMVAQRDESILKLTQQLHLAKSSSTSPATAIPQSAAATTTKAGSLTASSSYNMLEVLSDGKSDESMVFVGNEASSSSSSEGSLSESESIAVKATGSAAPLSTAVRKPAVAANRSPTAAATPATETQPKPRVNLLEVSLQEDEEDGWT